MFGTTWLFPEDPTCRLPSRPILTGLTNPHPAQMASKASSASILDRVREHLPGNSTLSSEEIFSILSNRRRRYTLHYLLHNGDRTDIREVAEQIAAWESDTHPQDVTSDTRKRVYTALQQNHLPSMADAGIVDYNKQRGTIETTEKLEEFDIYLEIVQGYQIPWSEYYVALSSGSLLLIGAVWTLGYPFTLLPKLAWAGIVGVIFLIASLTHLYETHQQKVNTSDGPPEMHTTE